jgi:hypothetical protein
MELRYLSEDFFKASKIINAVSKAISNISSKPVMLTPVPSLIWAEYIEALRALQ